MLKHKKNIKTMITLEKIKKHQNYKKCITIEIDDKILFVNLTFYRSLIGQFMSNVKDNPLKAFEILMEQIVIKEFEGETISTMDWIDDEYFMTCYEAVMPLIEKKLVSGKKATITE